MAIAQFEELVPTPARHRGIRGLAHQTRAALKLVPDLTVDKSEVVSSRAFYIFLIGIFTVGLLALLSVNTALTSGAFKLENLKLQLASVNDERDAVLNQVATYSSPDKLAITATKMGMAPQATINFLNISGTDSK